jgi:hypothetical protein
MAMFPFLIVRTQQLSAEAYGAAVNDFRSRGRRAGTGVVQFFQLTPSKAP